MDFSPHSSPLFPPFRAGADGLWYIDDTEKSAGFADKGGSRARRWERRPDAGEMFLQL